MSHIYANCQLALRFDCRFKVTMGCIAFNSHCRLVRLFNGGLKDRGKNPHDLHITSLYQYGIGIDPDVWSPACGSFDTKVRVPAAAKWFKPRLLLHTSVQSLFALDYEKGMQVCRRRPKGSSCAAVVALPVVEKLTWLSKVKRALAWLGMPCK